MTAIRINGVDVGASFGWYADDLPEWLAAPRRRLATAELLGRLGGLAIRSTRPEPRALGIKGTLRATSATNRRAAEDSLKDLLFSGQLTVVIDDGITGTRQIQGFCEPADVRSLVPSVSPQASRLEAVITCPDPTFRDVEPTPLAMPTATTRYSVPLGTAPSMFRLRIMGASTNPVVTYRTAGGAAVWTLTFGSTTLSASTDWLDLDATRGRIWKWASGVQTDAIALLTAGHQDWPRALDPQDGDRETSQWPTIEVSSGGAELLFWKQWI